MLHENHKYFMSSAGKNAFAVLQPNIINERNLCN